MEGVTQANARATVQAGHTLKERRTSREDFRSTLVLRSCREAEDLRVEPRKGANDEEDAFKPMRRYASRWKYSAEDCNSMRGARGLATGDLDPA